MWHARYTSGGPCLSHMLWVNMHVACTVSLWGPMPESHVMGDHMELARTVSLWGPMPEPPTETAGT